MEVPVAFTVYLNGDLTVSSGDKIPYDNIVINVGNGYSTSRREFVCPHAGLYVFYGAGYAVLGANCYLDIRKNNIALTTLYFREDHRTMGSNMAIVELAEGDNVSITSASSGCKLHGSKLFTTFSGFRIRNLAFTL